MTKAQIKKGNKLIAEFMGCKYYKQSPISLETDYWEFSEFIPYNGEGRVKTKDLAFDSSFDWLMPVVEKIENTTVKSTTETMSDTVEEVELSFSVVIKDNLCMIDSNMLPQYYGTDTDFLKLYDNNIKTKIDAVWIAVVKFIEWYNLTNNK